MARERSPEPRHRIDLHGMTVDQAVRHLERSLTALRLGEPKVVRIVVGRGIGSPDGQSRLAPAIESWLRGPRGSQLGVTITGRASKGGAIDVRLGRR